MYIEHFGVNIIEKERNRITRKNYLEAKPEGLRGWNEFYYERQRKRAALNFDANMRFFDTLDKKEFDTYVDELCEKHKFLECHNLKELDMISGVYVMVLDEYKQMYIGISDDIKKRIMSHWSRAKALERLIFGDICNSIISIDCFGALDTTRIYYIESHDKYRMEQKIVGEMSPVYLLNRVAGGIGSEDTMTETKLETDLALMATMRKKDLLPYIDKEKVRDAVGDEDYFAYYLKRYPQLES